MGRNRVIYQSEALYASETDDPDNKTRNGTGTSLGGCRHDQITFPPHQLQRVQNANYSFSIERQDVNQFGELAAIDRIILTSPTVSLDFQYLVGNMVNEKLLGFEVANASSTVLKSCISGILAKETDEKCYYIRTVGEGADVNTVAGNTTSYTNNAVANQGVIGLGNSYVTSYTSEGSVGNFPTVSINVEALNMSVYDSVSGEFIPAIEPESGSITSSTIGNHKFRLPDGRVHAGANATSVLRPGDVEFAWYDTGTSTAWTGAKSDEMGVNLDLADTAGNKAKLQSYNISFDLSRTPLEQLGSKFAFSREIDFPVTITMSLEAMVSEMKEGSLAKIIDRDQGLDIWVKIKDPASATINAAWHLKNSKLDSTEFSSGIGDNKSVTLNFSAQVGGPGQTTVGFFMSGVNT